MPHNFRFRNAAAVTALVGLACASTAHAQTTVVNQPTDLHGSDSSQNDTKVGGHGNFATSYDNFTLGTNTNINKVTWVGDFFTASPSPISAFTISFYSDIPLVPGMNGDPDSPEKPGALLQTETIAGNANETAMGMDFFGEPAYGYSATLSTPFAAGAGNTYWMSIVASVDYPPNWGWEQGTGGDGKAFQISNGFPNALTNDLAFTLISNDGITTPEPGSVALLVGMGLTGMTCLRRRKRVGKAS